MKGLFSEADVCPLWITILAGEAVATPSLRGRGSYGRGEVYLAIRREKKRALLIREAPVGMYRSRSLPPRT